MFLLFIACVPGQGSVPYIDGVSQDTAPLQDAWLHAERTDLDFDAVSVFEPQTLPLTLSNLGDTDLTFTELQFESAHFTLTLTEETLPAQRSTQASITFAPEAAGELHEELVIESDANAVTLTLGGLGLAADLYAEDVDLGQVLLDCTGPTDVTLINVGNAPLVVTSAQVVGTGFTVDDSTLPLQIAAGKDGAIPIEVDPLSEGVHTATLRLTTNDPAAPTVDLDLLAEASWETLQLETFDIGAAVEVDVLWYVDWSEPNTGNGPEILGDALSDDDTLSGLFDALDDAELDWTMGVIGDDDGCLEGDAIQNTGTRADQVAQLQEQVCPENAWDDATCTYTTSGEASPLNGLYNHMADRPTYGCRGDRDWMRDDAELLLLGVSSVPDAQQDIWYWLTMQIRLSARDDQRLIHFAGIGRTPVSTECAQPFQGWLQASNYFGGTFLDMCATTAFRDDLYALVEEQVPPSDRVLLSEDPHPESLTVWVDGARQESGWTLSGRHVRFDTRPVDSTVSVEYAPLQTCD